MGAACSKPNARVEQLSKQVKDLSDKVNADQQINTSLTANIDALEQKVSELDLTCYELRENYKKALAENERLRQGLPPSSTAPGTRDAPGTTPSVAEVGRTPSFTIPPPPTEAPVKPQEEEQFDNVDPCDIRDLLAQAASAKGETRASSPKAASGPASQSPVTLSRAQQTANL